MLLLTSFQRPYKGCGVPARVLNPGHGPVTPRQGTLTWSPVMAVLSWAQRSLALLLTLLPRSFSTFPPCADPALSQLGEAAVLGRGDGRRAQAPSPIIRKHRRRVCLCQGKGHTSARAKSLGRLGFKVLSALVQRMLPQASGSQQPSSGWACRWPWGAGTFVIKPSL